MTLSELGKLLDDVRRVAPTLLNDGLLLQFDAARRLADDIMRFGLSKYRSSSEILEAMMDDKQRVQAFGVRLTTKLPPVLPSRIAQNGCSSTWMGR